MHSWSSVACSSLCLPGGQPCCIDPMVQQRNCHNYRGPVLRPAEDESGSARTFPTPREPNNPTHVSVVIHIQLALTLYDTRAYSIQLLNSSSKCPNVGSNDYWQRGHYYYYRSSLMKGPLRSLIRHVSVNYIRYWMHRASFEQPHV